jgi:hypothetical protein
MEVTIRIRLAVISSAYPEDKVLKRLLSPVRL